MRLHVFALQSEAPHGKGQALPDIYLVSVNSEAACVFSFVFLERSCSKEAIERKANRYDGAKQEHAS